jgi:hypothetical protein
MRVFSRLLRGIGNILYVFWFLLNMITLSIILYVLYILFYMGVIYYG